MTNANNPITHQQKVNYFNSCVTNIVKKTLKFYGATCFIQNYCVTCTQYFT
jgi:hypothetical protein